jgi:hypothetical protein
MRELARGREHDRLHGVECEVDLLDDRDAEGRGLARARARLDDRGRLPDGARGIVSDWTSVGAR